jgi:pimeloyl-ACP methyl ester carboxylesterase
VKEIDELPAGAANPGQPFGRGHESAWLMMLESRAPFEFLGTLMSGAMLLTAPRGDGHAVVLVPGFMQDASSVGVLQAYLQYLGYDAQVFRKSALGATQANVALLGEQVDELYRAHGAPVSVVGWSFGGLTARAVAVQRPKSVRQVITLSAPFAGHRSTTLPDDTWLNAGTLRGNEDEVRSIARRPMPVPTSAIYSRSDGIAPWQQCINAPTAIDAENIEVMSSHIGMGVHPVVLLVIANRLSQPSGAWKAIPLYCGQPMLATFLPCFGMAG